MINNIIFDYDSTIINAEGIDLIIKEAIERANAKDKSLRLAKLKELTEKATNGDIPLSEAMPKRFALAEINFSDVSIVAENILDTINPMVRETIDLLMKGGKNIYVFSSSFEEVVRPVTRALGISDDNVFANQVSYDKNGNVNQLNHENPLFLSMGKVYIAERLKDEGRLSGGTAVVGDGFPDLAIRKNNIAKIFVYFSGTKNREEIRHQADFSVERFDQLLPLFCSNDELGNDSVKTLTKVKIQDKSHIPHITLLENIHPKAINRLKENNFKLDSYNEAWDEKLLCSQAKNTNVLGIRSKTKITAKAITCLPNLWVVGAFCIGTNQIDLVAATNAGIPVFNAPFSNTRSVAELVVGEAIILIRRAYEKSVAAHQGQWLKDASGCSEIRGKTIGIVGYGHIGSQVSVLMESLGMTVIYHDIVDKLPLGNAKQAKDLSDLLINSDIVTLHVPDTPDTRNMIGKKEMSLMKKGSLLLNLSRGRVVELDSLRHFLDNGQIAGAGVDVFPDEPSSSSESFHAPLQNSPNVILTPHIGGSTQEAQENIASYVSEKIQRYISNGSTIGSVNFPEVELPKLNGKHRILHIHNNVPGVLAKINSVFARRNINVEGQILQTKGNIGYLIVDVDRDVSEQVFNIMQHITETIKIRRIT